MNDLQENVQPASVCRYRRLQRQASQLASVYLTDAAKGRWPPYFGHFGPTHRNETVGAKSENVPLDGQPVA